MNQPLRKFIEKIENLQSKGDELFPEGIFPAQRINRLVGYERQDTTIFFSAIICFTLKTIRENCDPDTQNKIDNICAGVVQNYPDFQNKDGLKSYNFWKTKPSKHFPNGHLFRHFEHFRIPDDVDDTAFVYLTTNPTPEERTWLKTKLPSHANGTKQWAKNTFPEYQSLKAYSTWFGKNMYVEFDVSVLSNLMYCIMHYNMPLNEYDEASLHYIRSVVETDRYLTQPFRCAHQYPRTPLIMYHVVRLISAFNPHELVPIREKLGRDIRQWLSNTKSKLDKVILSTSLIRLGISTERIPVESFTKIDFEGFYFFIAGLLTAYENPVLYKLSSLPVFHMHWVCEAHCWALLAEYEVLWNTAAETGISS